MHHANGRLRPHRQTITKVQPYVSYDQVREFLEAHNAYDADEGPPGRVTIRVGDHSREMRRGPASVKWLDDFDRLVATVWARVEPELEHYSRVELYVYNTGATATRKPSDPESEYTGRLLLQGAGPANDFDAPLVTSPDSSAVAAMADVMARAMRHTQLALTKSQEAQTRLVMELGETRGQLLLHTYQLQLIDENTSAAQIEALMSALGPTMQMAMQMIAQHMLAKGALGSAPQLSETPPEAPPDGAIWWAARTKSDLDSLIGHLAQHQLAAWPDEPEQRELIVALSTELMGRAQQLAGLVQMMNDAPTETDAQPTEGDAA